MKSTLLFIYWEILHHHHSDDKMHNVHFVDRTVTNHYCLLNSSTAGIIALLDEQQHELKSYALKKLDQVVNEFWPEIADYITKM